MKNYKLSDAPPTSSRQIMEIAMVTDFDMPIIFNGKSWSTQRFTLADFKGVERMPNHRSLTDEQHATLIYNDYERKRKLVEHWLRGGNSEDKIIYVNKERFKLPNH